MITNKDKGTSVGFSKGNLIWNENNEISFVPNENGRYNLIDTVAEKESVKRINYMSELWMLIGVGIICYGLMSFMCIYLLCIIIKWNNILYGLIILATLCVSMVAYSIIKVIKIIKSHRHEYSM